LVAQSTGKPYYADGEFFFKAERVEIKEFSLRTGSVTEKIRRAGERYLDGPRARQFMKSAAQQVEVKGNELHIHLSVWQLTHDVLLAVAGALVLLIFAGALLRSVDALAGGI